MTRPHLPPTRRALLAGTTMLLARLAAPQAARAAGQAIHVVKDPGCGCCDAWIEILRQDGFAVTTETTGAAALRALKRASGIPDPLVSCHTARAGGHVVEGHVPPAGIRRLLAERPHALGLSVPGMPHGAPGMGPEDERDAHAVCLILRGGRIRVFSHHDAA